MQRRGVGPFPSRFRTWGLGPRHARNGRSIEVARRREIDFVLVGDWIAGGSRCWTWCARSRNYVGFVSLCEALDLTTPSGRALAAEAGDGQDPARTRASAKPPPRRGDRSGVSLASEPYRNRGRAAAHGGTQNPFSGRRRRPMGEWQPGRGTWSRTAMVGRVESRAKVVAG